MVKESVKLLQSHNYLEVLFSMTQTLDLSKHTIDEQVLRVISDSLPSPKSVWIYEERKFGNFMWHAFYWDFLFTEGSEGWHASFQNITSEHAGSLWNIRKETTKMYKQKEILTPNFFTQRLRMSLRIIQILNLRLFVVVTEKITSLV